MTLFENSAYSLTDTSPKKTVFSTVKLCVEGSAI